MLLSKKAITTSQAAIIIVIIVVAAVGAAFLLTTSGPTATTTTTPPKPGTGKTVALVLPGSITDHGWDQDPYEGLLQAEAELGVTIQFTENVVVTGTPADYDRIIRDHISRGAQFVICHDFLCKDSLLRVAADRPDIFFAYDGDEAKANVVAYLPWAHEASYLAGILAAKLTKTGTVGVYNGVPIPIEVAAMNGFIQGVKSVNPNVNIIARFLGFWHDVARGRDLVVSMADAGADVVYGIGDGINVGGAQGAKDKGILFIGGTGDQRAIAEDTVITSVTWGLKSIVRYLIGLFVEGKIEGRFYEFTLSTLIDGQHVGPDIVDYSKVLENRVPADVKNLLTQKREDILARIFLLNYNTTSPV